MSDLKTKGRRGGLSLNPIRILHFIPLFDTGGTEKVVMDICQRLDPSRFESHVCTFFPGEYDRFFAQTPRLRHVLVSSASRQARTPLEKGMNLLKRLGKLYGVIKKERVHLIHTHHLGPLLHVWFLQQIMRIDLPWVHTEHNVPDLARGYAHPSYRRLKPLLRPLKVTGVALNVCAYLKETCRVKTDRIELVPNGVDLERFNLAEGRDEIRRELGLRPHDHVVGCIGNLRQEKNQQLAIQAVALLHHRHPRLKLVICGDGDQRDRLERLANSCGIANSTRFLGYRLDIPRILSSLDLFCLPSTYEGMPVSILEAWTAGKAVVATDVIGIQDLVTHGENGILVPLNQPQSMASAMERLLVDTDESRRLATNGRELVTQEYSIGTMVANYANIYNQIASTER